MKKTFLIISYALISAIQLSSCGQAGVQKPSALASISSTEDPVLVKANLVCRWINNDTNFDYDANFDPEFVKSISKDELTKIFQGIAHKYGSCDAVLDAHFKPGDHHSRTVFLKMSDAHRTVLLIGLDDYSDKIHFLKIRGVIAPEDSMDKREVMVPMSDGTRLYTLIFTKPGDTSPRPVVLMRSPYFHMLGTYAVTTIEGTAAYFVKQGYNFVAQAIRGTYQSEGIYHYLDSQEIDDGFDTIMWTSEQPFCNGKVAITGTSYDGFTSLAAGVRNPQPLKAIFAGGAPSNAAADGFVRGFTPYMQLLVYLKYNQDQSGVPLINEQAFFNDLGKKTLDEPDYRKYDKIVFNEEISEWNLITENIPFPESSFWNKRQITSRLPEISIPTFHIGGMRQDGDIDDVFRNFKTVEHQKNHHLILGFWDHGNSTPYSDDGSNLSPYMKERFDALLAFYLKDEPTEFALESRVQVASNKPNTFLKSDLIPFSTLEKRTLYFTARDGSFTLEEDERAGNVSSSYPLTPSREPDFGVNGDQNRHFVAKFSAQTQLLGPMSFDLYVKIDVPQTDLLIVFSKAKPDGSESFLCNCIGARRLVRPVDQGIIHVNVNSCPMVSSFEAGDSLHIYVSSNIFPTFLRNTNNDPEHFFEGFREGTLTLMHSEKYPSKLEFTVEP